MAIAITGADAKHAAANAAEHHDYIARRCAEGRIIGRHGSTTAYDTGCRCNECRIAHNERSREKRHRARARARQLQAQASSSS